MVQSGCNQSRPFYWETAVSISRQVRLSKALGSLNDRPVTYCRQSGANTTAKTARIDRKSGQETLTELVNQSHHESSDVKIASDAQTLFDADINHRNRQLPRTVTVRRRHCVTVTSSRTCAINK